MRNSLSPSHLQGGGGNYTNPYSKLEVNSISGQIKSPGPEKSPARKGPVVKTVVKTTKPTEEEKETEDDKTRDKKSTARSNAEKSDKTSKTATIAKKNNAKSKSDVKESRLNAHNNNKESLKVKSNEQNPSLKEKETLNVKSSEQKPNSKDKTIKSRTNSTISSKSIAEVKKQPEKNTAKMEVKGKKMKIPKLKPAPLTDKEKFDLLFEAYSKWGADENCAERGISAYQLTRWLKNVEMMDGKKVSINYDNLYQMLYQVLSS